MFTPSKDQLAALMDFYGDLSPEDIHAAFDASEKAVAVAKADHKAGRASYAVVKEALADFYAIRGVKARLSGGTF